MRTELVAASSSGPGAKSEKGRENMTSARARLVRMKRRYTVGEGPEVGDRVLPLAHRRELVTQHAEALEVELADDAGLVAEELVEGGRRRLGPGRQGAGGQTRRRPPSASRSTALARSRSRSSGVRCLVRGISRPRRAVPSWTAVRAI